MFATAISSVGHRHLSVQYIGGKQSRADVIASLAAGRGPHLPVFPVAGPSIYSQENKRIMDGVVEAVLSLSWYSYALLLLSLLAVYLWYR